MNASDLTQICLWLVTVVLSVIFTIVATEPIHILLARYLGQCVPRAPRGVKGLWKATYHYESEEQIMSETNLVELRQFGTYVFGRSLTAKKHWNRLTAKLRSELYLTGTWETKGHGELWHGSFQLVLLHDGQRMEGKWIGFDSTQQIQHGPWSWKLLERRTDKVTVRKTLNLWKPNPVKTMKRLKGIP